MPKTKAVSKKINKSALVRSLPVEMPAKEVVEKAKAQGVRLSVAYVYSIRNAAKRAGSTTAPRVGRPRGAAASRAPTSRVEDLLRAVAAELGLSRAIALLQAEQQKVHAVIGA
jgi:hypothetical protein